MFKSARVITICLTLTAITGCASVQDTRAPDGSQFFEGMGQHTRAVTTNSDEAQDYFNQGLAWMYAFNHDEAIRSFTHAAELDPGCAMAWWGVAICQGPNYNDPIMTDERNAASWDALQKALAQLDDESPAERGLIEALTHRYASPAPEDRTSLEQGYADAMAAVWAAYPDDSDVGTLYAESMMVQRPWMLYDMDKQPESDTPKIVATLERVMAMDPGNPGGNHLYIHAVEPSIRPDNAIEAADRLREQVPGSGHLRHMPSHIYVQVGQWDKSITQNALAMSTDAAYRELSPDQGIQHMYMVHNSHMLAFSAMMVGREKEAMVAARAMWADVPEEVMQAVAPFLDLWMCSLYDVQKRFGRWDDILAEPAPPEYLPITTAVWRAHRAVAFAAKKDFDEAAGEYEAFRSAVAAIPEDTLWGSDAAREVLSVSDYFIQGEIALQQGDMNKAARLLEQAAEIEDTLGYGEPPQWLQPVRHTLGAVYLTSGRFEDAERVYREDLTKWRNNGWSLYGLTRALEEQGRTEEAAGIKRQYNIAWAKADAPTTTSCKCIPET